MENKEIIRPAFFVSIFYIIVWIFLVLETSEVDNLSLSILIRISLAGIPTMGFLVLGYLEAVALVFRGFTMDILLSVKLNQVSNFKEIVDKGIKGQGVDSLIKNRIDIMNSLGLIELKNNSIRLTRPKGILVGRMGIIVKKILNIGYGN